MAEGAVNVPGDSGGDIGDAGGVSGDAGLSAVPTSGGPMSAPSWAIDGDHVVRGEDRVSLADLEDFSSRQRSLGEREATLNEWQPYMEFTQQRWDSDPDWQSALNALYSDDWQAALSELYAARQGGVQPSSGQNDPLAEIRKEVGSLRAQMEGQVQAAATQRARSDMQTWVAEVEKTVGPLSEPDINAMFEMANELGVFRTSTFRPDSGVNPLLKYVAPLVFGDRIREAELTLATQDQQKNATRAATGQSKPRGNGTKTRAEMTPEERQAEKLRLADLIANPPSP